MKSDAKSIIGGLQSQSAREQVHAAEEMAAVIPTLLRAAVEAVEISEHRMLVAERLWSISESLAPIVRERLGQVQDEDARFWLALLLVDADWETAMPLLMDGLENDDHVCLASARLATKGVKHAAPAMLDRLRRCGPHEIDIAAALMEAVGHLGLSLPDDVVKKFSAPDAPWQLRRLVLEGQ